MDPYAYPGTSVLKNLRYVRDPERLARFEADATSERIRELEEKPLVGSFDSRHLQAIHHHIFQDVYEWAGEFRTVNIGKSGDLFALKEHIWCLRAGRA
jgi:cell filamentation protein